MERTERDLQYNHTNAPEGGGRFFVVHTEDCFRTTSPCWDIYPHSIFREEQTNNMNFSFYKPMNKSVSRQLCYVDCRGLVLKNNTATSEHSHSKLA